MPFTPAGFRWRSWLLFVLATALALVAEVGFLAHGVLGDGARELLPVTYSPIYPLVALLCVLAALRSPDAVSRKTWSLFAGATAVFLVTSAVYWVPRNFGFFPSPLVSDLLASGRHLLVAAAIVALVPGAGPRDGSREFALDVAIVVGAAALLALQLWFEIPQVDTTQLLRPASPAYLVATAGAAAVAFVALSYFAVRSRGMSEAPALQLAIFAAVPPILVDIVTALAPAGTARFGAPTAVAGTWLLGFAALWQVRDPRAPRPEVRSGGERAHSPAPYVALVAVGLVLVFEASRADSSVSRVLLGGTAILLVLVMVRQYVALRESRALLRERAVEQERFARLLRNSSDAAILVAADGTIRFDVPVLGRLLGLDDTTLAGASIFSCIGADDRAALRAYLDALAPGETAVPVTVRAATPGGLVRHLEVVASNHTDDPALAGYVLNVRDVTEREALEARLHESQKLEGIGRLAGGVAHDFNNLLTAIISNCELLETDPAAAGQVAEEVRDIRRAADRAAELTRQLLQFARRQFIAPRVLLVEAVLAQVERLLKRVLTEHIVLSLDVRGGPLRIKADPTQLDQVILNLVVNARDAMPRGGYLSITARPRELAEGDRRREGGFPAGRYVEIKVTDTGVGMPTEVQSHIFEPFYTTKGVGEGTGLGLATTYGIVRQLGGQITVESEVGRGSTFTILLPATDEPLLDTDEPATLSTVARTRRGKGTILVAEDEPSVRSLAVRALRERGFEVLPAVDGEDALRLARAHDGPIDFLVSDLVMPHMGGVQLATVLRAMGHAPQVLFITGYAEGGELDAVSDVRGAEVLVKPFPPSTLLDSVARMEEREPLP